MKTLIVPGAYKVSSPQDLTSGLMKQRLILGAADAGHPKLALLD